MTRKDQLDPKAIENCFRDDKEVYDFEDIKINIRVNAKDEVVEIEISRMYEFLPMTFNIMKKLAELFGTDKFNINNWSATGCETCDYGSKYAHVITFSE